MLKRVCAIALTVAMLLSMVCTFSFASAAEPMKLRVEFENDGVAGRGETVKAAIYIDNYVECSAMGIDGTYDTTVFDAAAFDVAGITMETTAFTLGAKSAVNNGEFYFSVYSADAHLENVVMSESSFKLATVALKLKTDYFTTPGNLEVKFRAADMCWTDTTKDPDAADAVVVLDSDSYTTDVAEDTVSLKPITDKMELIVKDAPATVVRGQEFTVTVAAKNYKALASYGFDLNYDNTVLKMVNAERVLFDDQTTDNKEQITGDTNHVRVIEISAANMGQDAAEQDLAKVTFQVLKTATLNKDAGLNAKFVIKEGTDDNTLAYYVDGNVDPIEMVPDYEFTAAAAVANTMVVAKENMMALNVTTAATTVDRGDEVVLNLTLENAVPFSGMTVDILVDDTVFAVEKDPTSSAAYAYANIMEVAGKKVVRLMVVNGANMTGVTDLATLTLKVKDTAAFGKTQLKDAVIADASAFISNPDNSEKLVLDADYVNSGNLIEINIVCDHNPEGFTTTNNNDGTHTISCNVTDCLYRVIENCTAASSVETPATCTADGYYTKTCACQYVWTEASGEAALGHDLKTVHAGGVATAAKHTTTCSRGDYTVTEPCTFNEVVTGVATCMKNAQVTATCSACSYSYVKEVQNSKVAHNKTKIRYYAPTETATGKWSYYCDMCQDWPAANDEVIPAGHPFPDVTKTTSWFYDGVQYAKIIGVVSGDDKGNYNPSNNITRAEVATILVRYLGYEALYKDLTAVEFETYLNNLYAQTGVARKNLTDLKADKWFYRATSVACALGIFQGDNKNLFNPSKNISRQEFCLVLYRLYKDAGLKIDAAKTYADIAKVPNWSKEAVLWAGSVGLFNGDEKGNFNATQNATRAQVALLMMRIDVDVRDIEVM